MILIASIPPPPANDSPFVSVLTPKMLCDYLCSVLDGFPQKFVKSFHILLQVSLCQQEPRPQSVAWRIVTKHPLLTLEWCPLIDPLTLLACGAPN